MGVSTVECVFDALGTTCRACFVKLVEFGLRDPTKRDFSSLNRAMEFVLYSMSLLVSYMSEL